MKLTKEQRVKRDEIRRKLRNSLIVLALLPVIADYMDDMLDELPIDKIPEKTRDLLQDFRNLDEKFTEQEWDVLDQQIAIQMEFRRWIARNFL